MECNCGYSGERWVCGQCGRSLMFADPCKFCSNEDEEDITCPKCGSTPGGAVDYINLKEEG